jgi:dsDNA-specific endonuclease/ATPase MutS2
MPLCNVKIIERTWNMPGTSRVKSVTEDIEASYGLRTAAVADVVKETHQTLGNFHREHDKMAQELKRSLAASEKERKKEFARLKRELQGDIATIEKDTAQTLASLRSEHHEMAEVLRSELLSFQKDLSSAVENMLADTSADHRQAHNEWQKLTHVMATKRAGKVAPASKPKLGAPTSDKEEAGKRPSAPKAELGAPSPDKARAGKGA